LYLSHFLKKIRAFQPGFSLDRNDIKKNRVIKNNPNAQYYTNHSKCWLHADECDTGGEFTGIAGLKYSLILIFYVFLIETQQKFSIFSK